MTHVDQLLAELFTPGADPYPLYERLRAEGPVIRVGPQFQVVTGYDEIDAVLRDPRMLVQRQGGASMLVANPPEHTRMRRHAAAAFTPRRLRAMEQTVTERVIARTGWLRHLLAESGEVDFMAEFAYPVPIGVITDLLGVPITDHEWLREQASAITVTLEPAMSDDEARAAEQAWLRLAGYFADMIEERLRRPTDDLTTVLTGVLEGQELLANLILLLVAGFETTTNLLGNGLVRLLEQRPDDIDGFVEEVLRFDPPVHLTSRWSEETGEVLLLLAAGNRDPRRFDRPGVFDPTRTNSQPLSFGAGAHYCLGAALARMEARIAFAHLIKEPIELAAEPRRRPRLTLRGYQSLPIRRLGS